MPTRFFLDWIPFSSPAIQTNLIKAGPIDIDTLFNTVNIKGTGRISAVGFALRLDGIFLFAIEYLREPSANESYWDSVKVADYLRRYTFQFNFLPPIGSRAAWIYHTPTRVEDLFSTAYSDRLRDLDIGLEVGHDSLVPLLVAVASDDMAIAAMRRLTGDPLRGEHLALLHLKAQMGRRKNEIHRMLLLQEEFENSKRGFRGEIPMALATSAGTCLLIGGSFAFYEIIFPTDLGVRKNAAELFSWITSIELSTLFSVVIGLAVVGILRVLHWWYMKSYRRRTFILTNGLIYFANCCQYAVSVSKMYERLGAERLERVLKRPLYGHNRSFEGVLEDLKTRLQHEQMRFRDLGIRYVFFASVLIFLARSLAVWGD